MSPCFFCLSLPGRFETSRGSVLWVRSDDEWTREGPRCSTSSLLNGTTTKGISTDTSAPSGHEGLPTSLLLQGAI